MLIKECDLECSGQAIAEINNWFKAYNHETGGILGSKGEMIDTICFDVGLPCTRDIYVPNVDMLNSVLAVWATKGILFRGLIHSHAEKETLSLADIEYARQIIDGNYMDEMRMYLYIQSTKKIMCYKLRI